MKTRLIALWDFLQSSYWFLPTLLSIVAIALAFVVPIIDLRYHDWILETLPLLAITPSSAQEILSSIAGAMVTVAGVVFSITIVTLSIASSQLGPRLLRTYMNSTAMHLTLGVFVATSLYCLLVLSAIRSEMDAVSLTFTPHFSLALGVLMAVIGLGMLIYFIHRIAVLVQAPNVVQSVSHDLDKAIDRLFPEELGQSENNHVSKAELEERLRELGDECARIPAQIEGYIQAIDAPGLLEICIRRDMILHLNFRPGNFVSRDSVLAEAWPQAKIEDHLIEEINRAFIVGNRPTPRQDVECAVGELVEVAVRALSTGINDPFTAINCIDRLGASLGRLAERDLPSPFRYDDNQNLRVITRRIAFPDVLEAAFNMIRQYGADSESVMIRLLEALANIATHARRAEDREAILQQARIVKNICERRAQAQIDLKALDERFKRVVSNLAGVQAKSREAEGSDGSNDASLEHAEAACPSD